MIVVDGKVSSISYSIGVDDVAPRVLGNLVSVHSVHGYWLDHRMPVWVTSADDQSPGYRFKEDVRASSYDTNIESSLEVSFGHDAPQQMLDHAFQAALHCFWSVRGCHNGREILPLVALDKKSIEAATFARLASNNPCPDDILAGRVHYLPDIDVLLVEVTNSMPNTKVYKGHQLLYDSSAQYHVLEQLLSGEIGPPGGIFQGKTTIPSPLDPKQEMPNPANAPTYNGERLLIFSNHHFDSCAIIPATATAEAIVRATEPNPKHREDQIVHGLL